jgi:hypothetical protein
MQDSALSNGGKIADRTKGDTIVNCPSVMRSKSCEER